MFPIIHEALFQDTITQAYETQAEITAPSAISARSCVFAFLAFAGTHLPETKATSYIDVQGCAFEAQTLMPYLIEDATLTTLQTVMFLVSTSCH
jgi:hypothetical protein